MQGLVRRYLRLEMFLAAGLVVFLVVLVTSDVGLDKRTEDVLFNVGLVVGITAVVALTVRRRRGRDRAWRAACEGAGLQAVDVGKVWGIFRPEFPKYAGRVGGRDALATHDGAEGGEVWLYVRGEPKPGWTTHPALRGVLETRDNAMETDDGALGVRIDEARVSADEFHHVLHALAASVR